MVDPPRRLAAALAGAGAVLCVLGWYQISGQPTVPQQLPYLASATIPGAALLIVGLALALRTPWPRRASAPRGAAGSRAEAAPSGRTGLWRVPDGRYLHVAQCPLLDGRTDLLPAPEPGGEAGALRPCPLCRAGVED
ncbi:hypothetical protein KDK95_06445 [Actinospica sp. MGRD01-02]|uniref:Uncharacterized protein n=1 Tax=Actinospica acidithermotolerans TaxID=2828514 RepID=A0A941E9B7_9ACTN|nr:hypothetical protein [Actinospica acidithermotolerans]MBR7825940.1 hypothetical protein [Actinospica acidithermotolerans]